MNDPWLISNEEFEEARTVLIEQHGAIPPSLQRVIDHGGRFGGPDAAVVEFHISGEESKRKD